MSSTTASPPLPFGKPTNSAQLLSRRSIDVLYDNSRYEKVVKNQRDATSRARIATVLFGLFSLLFFGLSFVFSHWQSSGFQVLHLWIACAGQLATVIWWAMDHIALRRLCTAEYMPHEDRASACSAHIERWITRHHVRTIALATCSYTVLVLNFTHPPQMYSSRGVVFATVLGFALASQHHLVLISNKSEKDSSRRGIVLGIGLGVGLFQFQRLPPDIASSIFLVPIVICAARIALVHIDRRFRQANVLIAAGVLEPCELMTHGIGAGSRFEAAREVWASRLTKEI